MSENNQITFEEFKKEVEKDIYDINEIAFIAVKINADILKDDPHSDIIIKAINYLDEVQEAEFAFIDFLETKGLKLDRLKEQ